MFRYLVRSSGSTQRITNMPRRASRPHSSSSNFSARVGSGSPSVDDITATFLAAYPDRVIPALLENPKFREQVRTALAELDPDKKPSKEFLEVEYEWPYAEEEERFTKSGLCHVCDAALTQRIFDGYEGKSSFVLALQDLVVDIQKNIVLNPACAPLEQRPERVFVKAAYLDSVTHWDCMNNIPWMETFELLAPMTRQRAICQDNVLRINIKFDGRWKEPHYKDITCKIPAEYANDNETDEDLPDLVEENEKPSDHRGVAPCIDKEEDEPPRYRGEMLLEESDPPKYLSVDDFMVVPKEAVVNSPPILSRAGSSLSAQDHEAKHWRDLVSTWPEANESYKARKNTRVAKR